jgi:hypothetical protein
MINNKNACFRGNILTERSHALLRTANKIHFSFFNFIQAAHRRRHHVDSSLGILFFFSYFFPRQIKV